MDFDFSDANIARIKKAYRVARQALSYRQAERDHAYGAMVRVGYRNLAEWQAKADANLAAAQEEFDAIKNERDAYRARGFCR